MNFLGGTRRAAKLPPQPAFALRVQSSVAGVARAFGYGLARIAGNLIGFWDFAAAAVSETSAGGGKGGGSSGAVQTGWNYSCAVAIGLAEGPIDAVLQGWSNKAPEDIGAQGFLTFEGGYAQSPWPWLIQNQPGYAQNFRGLAYVAAPALALGDSPTLPNLTFEVRFAVSGCLYEDYVVASPYSYAASFWDLGNSATEMITVPYAAPYQVTAQNSGGASYTSTYLGALGTALANTAVAGAFYTDSDPIAWLTPVTGTPSAGQYKVTSGGVYTFAAADTGAAVTIVDVAVSPGVNYVTSLTGAIQAGAQQVTGLASIAGLAVGRPVTAPVLPPGAIVQQLTGGSATGSVTSGSTSVSGLVGAFAVAPGTPVSDSGGAIPAGATVAAVGGATLTLSAPAAATIVGDTLSLTYAAVGTIQGPNLIQDLSGTAGIAIGAAVNAASGMPEGGSVVIALAGNVATIDPGFTSGGGFIETFYFTQTITGDLANGSATVMNLSATAALVTGMTVLDAAGAIPGGGPYGTTTVNSVNSAGSLTLSAAATATVAADVLSFPNTATVSLPAFAGASAATFNFVGLPLEQVLNAPAAGQFALTAQGNYSFAAADAGKIVRILDISDANPADVLQDFLTNPYYGLPQFPAGRLGDLSTYRAYCLAQGLWVSPVLISPGAANQFVGDLMQATNAELVWSGGFLTAVPYGDTALSANGASYTPPAQPIYSLGDDDFLPNQATNSASAAAASSPDPVTLTRLDPADQINDLQIEYLDRGNAYNPTIVEVQDDAAIGNFGRKAAAKQLHLFCDRTAALASAALQLGRQQVRNVYAFTVDRKYILLDPMDIVAITDVGLGLASQWVRIREITENDDRSLSLIAEEYLQGTGATPIYGHQAGAGYMPNFNIAAGNAL